MTITTGSHALIEDEIVWRVPAGADAYLGPFALVRNGSTGDPVDLTGYTAGLQVRRKFGGDLMASLSTDDGTATVEAAAGKVAFHLPAAASRGWPVKWTSAVFDAELYAPDGTVVRLCNGRLDIAPNVTQEDV